MQTIGEGKKGEKGHQEKNPSSSSLEKARKRSGAEIAWILVIQKTGAVKEGS
jgi:hypothetical protein